MLEGNQGEIHMSAAIYDIPVKKISGEDASLADFKGQVVLVVNVASKCGLTPQYEALESLYERFRGQGLVIAGFPANDFKSQEPGSNDEIQSFCTLNYGVKFPLFGKITVVGDVYKRQYRYSFLQNATLPKLFLSGDQDEFATAAQLEQLAASAADPKRLVLIPGADHFFTGQLEPMQHALAGWLKEYLL